MNVIILNIIAVLSVNFMTGGDILPAGSAASQAEKPLFTFGVVADIQYSDYEPGISRFYRGSVEKLEVAVGQFRSDSVRFIVNLGDLIDKDFNSYKPVMDVFDRSGIRIYHVAGNHDYSVAQKEKKNIPVLPAEGQRYYSDMAGNFRMIFLDGNDVSIYGPSGLAEGQRAAEMLKEMRSKGENNALDWNGALGKTQLKWLKNELKAAQDNNEKVLIFCHFPVAPDDAHNLLNDKEVLEIINSYPAVKAWFCGHNHQGNYARTGNIHHVNFRGMVETEHDNSFAVLSVYNDRIEIRGFGREPDRILEF